MNRSTAALVALEDEAPDELFATVPGTDIPLWPLLRWPLASAMSNTEFDILPAARIATPASKALRTLRALTTSPRASRRLREHADILFVGSGNMVARTPAGVRNLLFEDFAESVGDAAILQDAPLPAATPPSFARTWSFDDAIVRSELAGRLARRRAGRIEELARAIAERVDFPIAPALRERAIRTTIGRGLRAPRIASEFGAMLDRVRPRLLVVQGATYGDRAPQLREAAKRGIRVAEAQHGWIGAAHAAYNFGAAARDPRLASTLPDVLLTFGEFWSDDITVPFETVPIGKPHLEAAAAHTVPPAQREQRILVASNVVRPVEAARFVLAVRDALPENWSVTFRPHPQERSDVAGRYPTLMGAPGVDIDPELDAYASFSRSRGVIAGPSTLLYEALALDCPVVLRRSNITDYYMHPAIFPVAIDADEEPGAALRALVGVEHGAARVDPVVRERLWASGSRERFSRWAAALS